MTDHPTPLRVYFHLLDRQIVDRAGAPVGKVDDVEIEVAPDGTLRIVALLCGLHVLGRRMGGWAGRMMSRTSRRLAENDNPIPIRVPWNQVDRVESAVILTIRKELLHEPPLEKWLCANLIEKIPGAGDAG